MSTEITPGGQASADASGTFADASIPYEQRFTPGFIDHDAADGQPDGGEGMAWFWQQFEQSFSDVERDVVETIATPEHLVTVMTLSATHTGPYRGHEATGRRFTVRNVQVVRLSDGRASERWGATDELGILQQLGLT